MKVKAFLDTLKSIAMDRAPRLFELHADLSDEVAAIDERFPGILPHLNVEGVWRNGLEVSAEAHHAVETMRQLSRDTQAQARKERLDAAVAALTKLDADGLRKLAERLDEATIDVLTK